ncbi:MAG TPA: HDOD domain-containing protein [Feifaniaceae bacterium]|nr:HDOD domain-containing protein [Feifaniaceae bacterium]
MKVYVARQPVYDFKHRLYGYELLYRKGNNNFYEGEDGSASTVEVISNSFLVMGFNELTENTRGFINFPEELLLNDVARLLPKGRVVIELLESVCASKEVLLACRRLKALGYTLALDDYVIKPADENTEELIGLADIIKIQFPLEEGGQELQFLHKHRGSVRFLAERIETQEQFEQAKRLGFTLFQGYYFSRPVIVNARDIDIFKASTSRALEELGRDEPDFKALAEIFEHDTGLSYKLLKLANSAFFSFGKPVKSISEALIQIGTTELTGWIYLLFLRSIQTTENRELIKNSIIRGRLISQMCARQNFENLAGMGVFVGIFSNLDVIVGQSMESMLDTLPLVPVVKDTLLNRETIFAPYLRTAIALENGEWDALPPLLEAVKIDAWECMRLYIEALCWQQRLAI